MLVHAASVDTLTGTGLFTLTSKGKLVSELSLFGLLALIGLVIEVAAIKKCSRLDEEETAIQEFQLARSILWMNGCATALLFLVFTMGVQYLRLLWMDLFVILGLHWILYFVLSSIRSRSRQSHGSMSSVVPENGADAC